MRLLALLLLLATPALAQDAEPRPAHVVTVQSDDQGHKLLVDGEDFFVAGMNWGYVPIGTNYSYNFWAQDEAFIEEALHREMTLFTEMGGNAIRQYVGIPPKWVTWIWENYGVYTMVNHTVGRYGFSVNGGWVPTVDYSDPAFRKAVTEDVLKHFAVYKDTPGLLFYLLGNENNYGLHWSSFEIEALPKEQQASARATHLYSLFGEIVDAVKAMDPGHPVSIANGDLQYIDLIVEHVPNLDILGSNVYRGISSRDLFDVVDEKLGIPFVYTEFGADAYNARDEKEDGVDQATYLRGQWQEIYEQAAGNGGVGNAIGGFTFQWADGWWKYKQEVNLDVHDTNASWPNRAYPTDFVEGGNNMNEEWFGICGKTESDAEGHFRLLPRAAYYVLQQAYELDPYAPETDRAAIAAHFDAIRVKKLDTKPTLDKLVAAVEQLEKSIATDVRAEISGVFTGGSEEDGNELTADHMQSFWLDLEVKPTPNFTGEVSLNILGNVAANPIDEIFYERRGLKRQLTDDEGESFELEGIERLRVYGASVDWKTKWFDLAGFYRRGHGSWSHRGDFFGLYRNSFYGPNLDIYNGTAPFGLELTGKGPLEGVHLAFGPELHWGSNPAIIAMYGRQFGIFGFAVAHQEDILPQASVTTSLAVPQQVTRRTTAYISLGPKDTRFEIGGIMAGTERIGRSFVRSQPSESGGYGGSGTDILDDTIHFADTLGARGKFTLQKGFFHWYIQGEYRGLVADGGADDAINVTGWKLKMSGQGNVVGGSTGAAFALGPVQVAPHVLVQKPLEGPLTGLADHYSSSSDRWYPGVRARNQRDDPFFVRWNRETYAFELLLAYDPTPGSWMWQWDNEVREDAVFSASLDFTYRIQPTSTDSTMSFTTDGLLIPLGGGPPAHDVWDAWLRMIVVPDPVTRIVISGYAGQKQPNGPDPRLITAGGGAFKLWHRTLAAEVEVKVHDFGPYDYHRDFNFTFPLQLRGDLSVGVIKPRFAKAYTRLGISGQYRMLDGNSNRYVRDPANPDRTGNEWQVTTYLNVAL